MKKKSIFKRLICYFIISLNIISIYGGEENEKIKEIENSSEHFNNGVNYYIKRDYEHAASEFLKALMLNPQESKIKNYFDKCQEKFYQSQINFYDGLNFFKQGKYKEAQDKFKSALLINPRDKKAEYYLKLCYTPVVEIKTSSCVFSKKFGKNFFIVSLDKSITIDNWIDRWILYISDLEGNEIRKIEGEGDPKSSIEWDLKDNRGEILNEKKVKYFLLLKSIYGRVIQTRTNLITVDNLPPNIDVKANTNFYPEEATNNKVKFEVSVSDEGSGVENWWIEIYDNDRKIIKRLIPTTKEGKNEIIWDGSLDDGGKVEGGSTIYYKIIAYDKASNQNKTEEQKIEAAISLKKDERGLVMNLPNVEFDFGKATLKKSSYPILDKAGEILLKYKNAKFIIEGHTDDIGDENKNLILSQKRAESVYNYLSKKFGLEKEKVEIKGYGETRPIFPNTSEANRRKNRRVEIIIKSQ